MYKGLIKSLGEAIVKIIKAFTSCRCHCECCESDCQTRTNNEDDAQPDEVGPHLDRSQLKD